MWDPFKERADSMKYIINFFNIHLVSIFVFITINTAVIAFGIYSYIDRTSDTIPCSQVLNKLNEFKIPQRFELKPINENQTKKR